MNTQQRQTVRGLSSRNRINRSKTRASWRRGFTLIEIIVVVTIIALLATLVAPRLMRHVGNSKTSVAASEVSSLAQQVQVWMLDNGYSRVPDSFELAMLAEGADPYVAEKTLIDPWGAPYVIVVPGNVNTDFDIVSLGFDGAPGGDGEDQDIVN